MKTDNEKKSPETKDYESLKKNNSYTERFSFWDDVKKTLNESILNETKNNEENENNNVDISANLHKPQKSSSYSSAPSHDLNFMPSSNEIQPDEDDTIYGDNADIIEEGKDLDNLFDILKVKSNEKLREEIKSKKTDDEDRTEYENGMYGDSDEDDDVKIFDKNSIPGFQTIKTNTNINRSEIYNDRNNKNYEKEREKGKESSGREYSKPQNKPKPATTANINVNKSKSGNTTSKTSSKPKNEKEIIDSELKKQKRSAFSYEKLKKDILFNVSDSEYTSIEQNDEIFKNYSKVYGKQFIILIASVILFGLSFYLELAPLFKFPLPQFFNPDFYNIIYILIDLQLLMCSAVLVFESLLYGLKSLIKNNINIYSVSLVLFLITFVHTIITYNMKTNKPDISLFNAISIFLFIILTINNIMCIYRDLLAFKIVCSKKNKYGIKILKKPIYEKLYFSDFMSDTTNTAMTQVAGFITNFFQKSSKKTKNDIVRILFIVTAFEAVIVFGVSLALNFEAYNAISNIVILMLSALPFCAVITKSYPLFKIQKKLSENGAAIIGEGSLEEYSNTSVFSVYDRDIFPPDRIKVAGIRVYENNRIDTVLQHLSCLFETINSPLYHILKASSNFSRDFDKNIVIIDLKDEGICFVSNGKKFFAGNAEYVSNLGLTPPMDENFDQTFLKSSGNIFFLATESEIVSKMYLKYELTSDFDEIIRNLARLNICLGVRTLDPNIDDILLRKLVANPKFCIKTVKIYNIEDKQKNEAVSDAGVVSKTTLKSLIEGLAACNKTSNVIKSNFLIQIIAAVIGVVLACCMIFMGDVTTINTLHIFVFQSFWIVTVLVLSNLTPH